MSLRSLLTCLLFLFLQDTSLYAQQDDKKIAWITTKAMAEEEFPGMAVAVIQHNKVLFEKGFGVTTHQQKAATRCGTFLLTL